VRRLALPAVLLAVVLAGAKLVQNLDQDRHYRQLLATGERALRAGQGYAAVEAFSGAIVLRPDSMVAYYRRGEAYRLQGQDDWAIRDLRTASRLSPDAPQPLATLGDIYDRRGDPVQASEWYGKAAARLQDSDPAILYALALARYRAGFPAEAQAPLARAIERNPSMAEAHFLLGLVHRDAHAIDEAIASTEQAVRLAPTLVAAREELADLYHERGRSVDEVMQLSALATTDTAPARQVALALAEARRGQYDTALTRLTEANRTEVDQSRVLLAIGRVYLARAVARPNDRTSVSRAIVALERALGGTISRSEGLALYGRALLLSGDAPAAERILREATSTSPVELEAFAYLADAAEQLRHPLVARDALVQLDALEGSLATADVRRLRQRRIGALSLDAGDAPLALTYLTQALAAGPPEAGTLGLLARAKWQTGDPVGAKAALGQAMELDRQNMELLRLKRTIR